jgi:glutamate-1-semialdehyde 2,1-aminomutase
VVSAIARQAALGTSYGAPCEQELELARIILQAMPAIEMIRFVNSGTEAGMAVVRLARAFTGRRKILKFSGCYHGHADSLLVQAGSGVLTLGLPDSPGVTPEAAADTLSCSYNDRGGVEEAFHRYGDDIAAVILEPVVGNAGFIQPQPGFLEGLRAITTARGALLVFDEVMTGFRVHPGGAQTLYRVVPDLTMLGKVIGGGVPVGAYGGRRDIMQLVAPAGPVYQAGTLSGNPLAMVCGAETLRRWLGQERFWRAERVAAHLVAEVNELGMEHGVPVIAHAVGTMFGLFFHPGPVRSLEEAKQSDEARFRRFFHLMLARGVYFAPSPFEAGFVSVAHEGAPLDHTIQALAEVFAILGAERSGV